MFEFSIYGIMAIKRGVILRKFDYLKLMDLSLPVSIYHYDCKYS